MQQSKFKYSAGVPATMRNAKMFQVSIHGTLLRPILYSKLHIPDAGSRVLFVTICCYLVLFVAISCYFVLFVRICCYLGSLFVAICYYLSSQLLLFVAILQYFVLFPMVGNLRADPNPTSCPWAGFKNLTDGQTIECAFPSCRKI